MNETTASQRERFTVSVGQYAEYHRNGYLILNGLLEQQDIARLQSWTDDIYYGRVTELDHLSRDHAWMKGTAQAERLSSARMHMPHQHNETAEWGLLHPRLLDVLEALIGPDVLALQSMLFFNPPGKGGQGWHQDSFYIQTQPDSLIGAWVALDRADEQNGCLWVAPGSHNEPIYPPAEARKGYVHADGRLIRGLEPAKAPSVMDDEINNLSTVAAKYGASLPVVLEPGDVLFFHSHLLHRSYRNETADRFRRAYVLHYCNARSRVPWNGSNENHILARGRTHLPYATPALGTTLELPAEPEYGSETETMMVAMPGGDMGMMEM